MRRGGGGGGRVLRRSLKGDGLTEQPSLEEQKYDDGICSHRTQKQEADLEVSRELWCLSAEKRRQGSLVPRTAGPGRVPSSLLCFSPSQRVLRSGATTEKTSWAAFSHHPCRNPQPQRN